MYVLWVHRTMQSFTHILVYNDNVYSPLVEEFLTTKQPSLSSCLSNDSDLWRDMSPTYHLQCTSNKSYDQLDIKKVSSTSLNILSR